MNLSLNSRVQDVIYALNHYFVGADGNFLARSVDGNEWSLLDLPANAGYSDILSLAFGNNLLVAGSSDGNIISSANGVDWTLRYGGTIETFQESVASMVFANGLFVGVGERSIVTSTDGIHWAANRNHGGLTGIAFGNGMYVALGRNGNILTSPDAVVWEEIQSPLPDSNYSDVAFDGHEFVAVGREGKVATSYDGTSWITRVTFEQRWFTDVTAVNGMTVITPPILTSSRGAFWDLKPVTGSITGISPNTFEFGGDQFITTGDHSITTESRQVNRSADGIAWTQTIVAELGSGVTQVDFALGNFLGVRKSKPPLFSTTGTTWTEPQQIPWAWSIFSDESIASNDTTVIFASTDSTEIRRSMDARTWESLPEALPTRPISRVFSGNGEFLIPLADSKLARSTNGLEWVTETLTDFPEIHAAAYGNGTWVGLWRNGSYNPRSATSTDRVKWINRVVWGGGFEGWNDIVFADGLFVAAGPGISTSADGETWVQEAPDDIEIRRIITANGRPVVTTVSEIARRIRAPALVGLLAQRGIPGSPFSYQVLTHNMPAAFQASGLPNGLSINGITGLISGVPEEAGEFFVSLETTNQFGMDAGILRLNLTPLAPTLADVPEVYGLEGHAFRFTIRAANLPTEFFVEGLPEGLSVDPDGVITGVPAGAGRYTATLSATNQHGSDTGQVDFVIDSSAPLFVGSSNAIGTRYAPFAFHMDIHNGPATFDAIDLPDGLEIDAVNGLVSGTPTARGTFTSTITATNAFGSSEILLEIELRPTLPDALDAEERVWTTGGRNDWFGQTRLSADGNDAARSGAIGYSSSSWLETAVTGPAIVSFKWFVSSAERSSRLVLTTDNLRELDRISGISMADWETKNVFVDTGEHTLKWRYERINFTVAGEDAGWVDQFETRPLNSYEMWAWENFGDALASPLGDSDLDRVANLIEFGLGDRAILPEPETTSDGSLTWIVTVREDPNLVVIAEFCSDLKFVDCDRSFGSWTSRGDGFAQVVFEDPGIGSPGRRFLRLQFSYANDLD